MADFFRLQERKTSIRTEILGGATTFATMAYIIVVNPAILNEAGISPGPSTVATILAAVFGCVAMGLYANRPIAVAPYMGENAFIAFGLSAILIDGQKIGFEQRLGTVFIAGAAFLLLTLLRIRTWLAEAISPSMKYAFAVGIGLFLLLLGLYQTGIVQSGVTGDSFLVADAAGKVANPPVPLKIGDLRQAPVQLAIVGFLLMMILLYWNVRGAILIGIFVTGLAGCLLGIGDRPTQVVDWPIDRIADLSQISLHLDIAGVLRLEFLPVLITLCLVSFLDTLGTLVAVGAAGDMLDDKGNFPDIQRPMIVDSVSCMFSALVGTSTSGAYIESATGIRAGARTGLAAIVTGLLFVLALFFLPLVGTLQKLTFAWGPALMVVGLLMLDSVRKIAFDDLTELVPAVASMALIVFTYNIANGLTAGLILYPLFKLAAGRWREIHPGAVILAALCLVYYVFGVPH